jgi:hypothetical protein
MKTKKVKVMPILMGVLLMMMLLVASCSKDDPSISVNKETLNQALTEAKGLISTTREGAVAGQFPNGAQAILQEVIDLAQVVADNATATQAEVDASKLLVQQAITTYLGKIVVGVDLANLVGQWTFDEITTSTVGGMVKDYSGNNHNGTIKQGHEYWGAGIPTLAPDRYGNANRALYFDEGANVEIPYSAALNPPNFSISVWVKQDVSDYWNQYIMALNRWHGYKLQMQNERKAQFTVKAIVEGNPDTQLYDNLSPVMTQNQWWHIVVTFGEGNMKFYLNGALVETYENTPGTAISIQSTPINIVFGQDLPTGAYSLVDDDPNFLNWGGYFIGTLDEFRMYKSVLTPAQITSIYTIEKPSDN